MWVRRILQWSNTDSDEDCHSAITAAVAAAIDTHSIRIQIDVHSFINLTGLCLSGMCSNNRSLITAQWIVLPHNFTPLFPRSISLRALAIYTIALSFSIAFARSPASFEKHSSNKRNIQISVHNGFSYLACVSHRKRVTRLHVRFFFIHSFIFPFLSQVMIFLQWTLSAHTPQVSKKNMATNRPIILGAFWK